MEKQDPKVIAKKYIEKLEKIIGKKLIYRITGSVAKGSFKWGKSDIDIVFVCEDKKEYLLNRNYAEALKLANTFSKKYYFPIKHLGNKDRKVDLIDILLTFSNKLQKVIREILLGNDLLREGLIEQNKRITKLEKKMGIKK